jgi:hypothetical protein
MKSFKEIREAKSPPVFKKKMGKYPVEIVKDSKGFVAYIDGDKLDTFRSEGDAKKAITAALKELP